MGTGSFLPSLPPWVPSYVRSPSSGCSMGAIQLWAGTAQSTTCAWCQKQLRVNPNEKEFKEEGKRPCFSYSFSMSSQTRGDSSPSSLPLFPCHLPLLTPVFAFTVGSDPPTSCCFTYIQRELPRSFVTDYYETNSLCSQPGVVFITRKGREVCANPEHDWVQKYVTELELN
ncbi:C-C motif chemokine 3-like isoform X1 [Cygnus atratus]|uniref:C-C motif chemokine 3-like isoform X1 n=1 Tax=Cygnus atratus TaxID=8868 RepID=UPI0015D5FF67|nr:C-C motif chemokine 3-like isoform X1 [Cygnus atratus]